MGYWLGNIAGKGGVKHPRFGDFAWRLSFGGFAEQGDIPSAKLDPGRFIRGTRYIGLVVSNSQGMICHLNRNDLST